MSLKRVGFIDGRRVSGWRFPANATPGNGQAMVITDPSIGALHNRGVHLTYNQSGAKTGAGRVDGLGVDMIVSANSPYVNTMAHYIAWSGTPVVAYATGGFWYLDNPGAGNNLVQYCGLMLGMDVTNPPVKSTFMRVYGHGGAVGSVIWLANSAGTPITNLLDFEGLASPISAGTDSVNVTHKIAMLLGATTKYLHVFSD